MYLTEHGSSIENVPIDPKRLLFRVTDPCCSLSVDHSLMRRKLLLSSDAHFCICFFLTQVFRPRFVKTHFIYYFMFIFFIHSTHNTQSYPETSSVTTLHEINTWSWDLIRSVRKSFIEDHTPLDRFFPYVFHHYFVITSSTITLHYYYASLARYTFMNI